MATTEKSKANFASMTQGLSSQFRGLNPNDPATWPLLPQALLYFALMVAIVAALWFTWLNSSDAELEAEQKKELKLRDEYKKKLAQAVNLEALGKQRVQVLQYVTQLEKQLPSKAEMDALLSDINQAGLGRSLNFDLFRPGNVVVKDYYAELPITLRVTGRFHDLGSFASDIANLSRIVTLNNLRLAPVGHDNLAMEATAKTFRYLDQDEVASQKKVAPKKGAKK